MSSNDWERFKAIILHRYLIEKISLQEVIYYMEQEHNFSKKKSQYEYQFKKWGVKKNSKKKDWENLRHQLERRAGKQSEVTLFGVPLSPGSVRRKTQRYTSIPTAKQFGKKLPSPEILGGTVVRAQSPIIIDDIVWPALPWFHFKNRILPRFRDPSALLRTLFITLGSESTALQYQGKRASASLFEIFRNPINLRQTILHLTNAIPDDDINGQEMAHTLSQGNSSLWITRETLKIIFFRLSNKFVLPRIEDGAFQTHDQFVLHLVEAISRIDPEMLSHILFDDCVTSKAIGEVVYGSAIREKRYAIVSRLLESKSVNPDMRILVTSSGPSANLRRGLLVLSTRGPGLYSMQSGVTIAAYTRDTRLAKMLLRAGASLSSQPMSILELACAGNGKSTSSMGFVELLEEYGVINDYSASCGCPYPSSELISPIVISIAEDDDCTANFLIKKFLVEKKEADTSLPQYPDNSRCGCCGGWYYEGPSALRSPLRSALTPLHLAIMTRNEEIIGRLLLPVISYPPRVSVHVIREAFFFSCLAGDVNTASKLLARHSKVLIRFNKWGITPLAAAAWNTEDTSIAETLLRLSADIGPTRSGGLAPIHIAAYYGNTRLVQQLLLRGADCNVRYLKSGHEDQLMKLPTCESALQFALAGERTEIVRLLMPHSRFLGSELIQAVALRDDALFSEFISKGADIMWTDKRGETVLEAAVKTGNKTFISHYFSLGGIYRSDALGVAIERAIESKDHSIARMLASHRQVGDIDSREGLSLIFAIRSRQWDLVSLLLEDPFIPGSAGSQLYADWSDTDCRWDKTPLCAALLSENKYVIEAMTKRGYTLHHNDIWPLMEAAHESVHQELWNQLSLQNIDLSSHRAFLVYAIESSNIEKVREYVKIIDCLDFNCEPYTKYPYEDVSPLVIATRYDSIEILRILLDAGAGVDFIVPTYERGETALQHAATNGHLHLVKFLLDRGARVDPLAQLEHGATPLQYSAIWGHLKIAQLLVSYGANINAPPAKQFGRTTLEGAAEHGRLDMVQFLLKMEAQIDGKMRTHFVRSVAFAEKEGHHAIANYLKQYGLWGQRDETLRDRRFFLDGNVYFRYDEASNNWRVRKRRVNEDDDWYSTGSSDFSEFADSNHESEDYESGEDGHAEYDGYELYNASYDADYMTQRWVDNMNLTTTRPSGLSTTGIQVMPYCSASSQRSTTQRVIEIDDGVEDADVVQFDVGIDLALSNVNFNMASMARADNRATDEVELWEPGGSWQ
ncbi:ankyrin repeat-containing domain protein [Nemania sp. FL0031]|nr:ankyrin repeat-containing domain protein [Nemania sp. FL0031]